jgi:MinD superfamily P-loop ATPase
MKQLVILSGKGGTGKTTVAAALAHLASRDGVVITVDADVDAPNLNLLLRSEPSEGTPFYSGQLAEIDQDTCIQCGTCAEVCRFEAVMDRDDGYWIDPIGCEGCAACHFACPAEAIRLEKTLDGYWFHSRTRFGDLYHARLATGAENSGIMVSTLRQAALANGYEHQADWVIIDGAPGIGCPVIAAVTGTDLALIVSEPTVSGVHDLERAMQICAHFGVPTVVLVNKADINPDMTDAIATLCSQQDVSMLGQLPYDEIVTEAMRNGLTVTEASDNPIAAELTRVWQTLRVLMEAH